MSAPGLIDFWIDERLDQTETFGYTLALDDPKADLVVLDSIEQWRDRKFRVSAITDERDGTSMTRVVEGEALWYDLNKVTRVGGTILSAVTPSAGLATLLDGTGWSTGVNTTTSVSTYSMEGQDLTVLALLRKWAKITGTYLRFDTVAQRVDLAAASGRDLGLGFRYGRNLQSIERRSEAPVCTVLYAYGQDALTIAGVNGGLPYVEDYTFYTAQGLTLSEARTLHSKSRVWSDTSFLVDTELLTAAEAKIAKLAQPTISYECKVVDLSELTGISEAVMAVGDTLRVSDPEIGVDLNAIIVRIKRFPLEPWRNELELAFQPDLVDDTDSDSARSNQSEEWVQFLGPVRAEYRIRNDGDYFTNRIPLRFREGGRANFHLDLWVTGVGAGDLVVTVVDANNGDAQQFKQITVPYTDGATARAYMSWGAEELEGSYDFRVKVTTTASGGPDGSKGVNLVADDDDPHIEASFWIMAQGAVRETPTQANSIVYDYTGAVQTFTVPENVTEVTIDCLGGSGGAGAGSLGLGGEVTASFSVTPGTIYDVYVGGQGENSGNGHDGNGGWPNGGDGGDTGSAAGAGGGGSSDVRPTGTSLSSALIVAAGGGGQPESSGPDNAAPVAGDGGFYTGGTGYDTVGTQQAAGASQFAGGTGNSGGDGAFNSGGDALDVPNPFVYGGGGGGGGWYGGEGGVTEGTTTPGVRSSGGGGGTGWLAATAFDPIFADGANSGNGQITISWDDPIEGV